MPSASTHKMHSIDELRSLIAPVAEKYGVARVYLFGSVARGDYDDDSDYDFCIETGKIDSLLTMGGFFMDLQEAVGNEIDLVTTRSLDPEFLSEIMKDGVVIYEN